LSRSKRKTERFSSAAALLVIGASFAAFLPALGQAPPASRPAALQDIPPLEELGRRLFETANRERVSRGLPALRSDPALEALAREQSEDMARLGLLAHLSGTGDTLTERLRKAGVYFTANAENVARSDSFDPELLHESFMNSPEHRKALLNPEFDETGMAIARGADGDYYATQDFIRSLTVRDEQEVRERVLETLGSAALERGAAALIGIEDLHRTAEGLAREKGAGRNLAALPPEYGAAAARFIISGDFEGLLSSARRLDTVRFRFVGVGSWFGRTPEYPGGAYAVCLLLLAGDPAPDLSADERRRAVLDALNRLRTERGRQPLELDPTLCRRAAAHHRAYLQKRAPGPPRGPYTAAWFYRTLDLNRVPDGVHKAAVDRAVRKAGISVIRALGEESFHAGYSVAVLFDE